MVKLLRSELSEEESQELMQALYTRDMWLEKLASGPLTEADQTYVESERRKVRRLAITLGYDHLF